MDAATLVNSSELPVTQQHFKIVGIKQDRPRKYAEDLGLYVDLTQWPKHFNEAFSTGSLTLAKFGEDRQFDSWPFRLGERPGKLKKKVNYFKHILDCEINNVTVRFILPKLDKQFYPQWLVWAAIGEYYVQSKFPKENLLEVRLPFLSESLSIGPAVSTPWNTHRLLPFVDRHGLYFHDYMTDTKLSVG